MIINGSGRFGKLTPVVSGGQITRVIVDNPGIDYTDTTTITIKPSGLGANLNAEINQWTINLI